MKLDDEIYDIHFYYIKNSKPNNPGNHSLGCVCLIRDRITDMVFRGISFCSPKERYFNKAAARGIAYQRAYAAVTSRMSGDSFVPTESTEYAVRTMNEKYGFSFADGEGIFKSGYGITPTKFEESILNDR